MTGYPQFQLRDPRMANSPNAYPGGEWKYQIVGQFMGRHVTGQAAAAGAFGTAMTGLFLVAATVGVLYLYAKHPVTTR
jgi:hypothetical protein